MSADICIVYDDVGVGGSTQQHVIIASFCHITGFTSDFPSFIVVEHIWFFHGAIQLQTKYVWTILKR